MQLGFNTTDIREPRMEGEGQIMKHLKNPDYSEFIMNIVLVTFLLFLFVLLFFSLPKAWKSVKTHPYYFLCSIAVYGE